ncbi:hypothetical protein CEXT_392931 [Caerostris extrusa]|uniref:Uncharacterized protein n=1 Tax=Caerostris extrusa TaxID=172846 RepID=A0AAV4VLJ2_CAEEX|nr:hypothetical protein CEXT_392931 [Caerostris extrusa]
MSQITQNLPRTLISQAGCLVAKRAPPKRAMPPTNRSKTADAKRPVSVQVGSGESARTSRSILVLLMCCPERDPGSIDP